MKKHLSIFSIAIALIFSFLFTSNVKAEVLNGLNIDETFINRCFSEYLNNYSINKADYPLLVVRNPNNGNAYYFNFSNFYTVVSSSSTSVKLNMIQHIQFKYNKSTDTFSDFQRNSSFEGTFQFSFSKFNFDVYNGNTLIIAKNLNYNPTTYFNVNFHLNGGTIIDISNPLNPQTYQGNFTLELNQSDLNSFINSQTPINGSSEFLGWYYDANFTTPYTPGDSLSSDIDLYAKWETPKTFNIHLNGGYVYDPSDGWGSEEDFSITLYNSEIEDFFTNLEVKKYLMLFDGWYYDNNYRNIFHINDNFTEDTYNLYAKWRYEKVDDFLANTNFNEYTFDENYQYAIINRGNNGDSIYLGLPFSSFSLEVYEYNESTYKVKDGSSACLTPIYKKTGFSIYDVNTLYTSDQEVLILPRILFDNLDPNDFQDPEDTHHFYLTDNAYVSYTNNLSEADIVDSNGDHITINLQDSYELSQQYQEIYSNPENIFAQINIFLNKMSKITSAIKGIFVYLFGSLNSTIQAFIIFLIVVVLISAIMSFIRRS